MVQGNEYTGDATGGVPVCTPTDGRPCHCHQRRHSGNGISAAQDLLYIERVPRMRRTKLRCPWMYPTNRWAARGLTELVYTHTEAPVSPQFSLAWESR
jgi:hypothetical protein